MKRVRSPGLYLPILMAFSALVGGVLALTVTFRDGPDGKESGQSPGITLGLTAEARRSLQQGGAFPRSDAGFSAYYRVSDAQDGFALDKGKVDQAVMDVPKARSYRAAPASLLDIGATHSVVSLPVKNIGETTTRVNLYYDSNGWVVAYFDRNGQSSTAWQARGLDEENPALDTINIVLLDAVNAVVEEALKQTPVDVDTPNFGFYHWGYPTATNFYMMANARGTEGTDTMSFAVPATFNMLEVSVSLWVSGTGGACARVTLDGEPVTGVWCGGQFHHATVGLQDFNARTGHTMLLEHLDGAGASGAMLMLVYSVE